MKIAGVYIIESLFFSTNALNTECLDQVQINFPMTWGSFYANGTLKVLGNNVSLLCPS